METSREKFIRETQAFLKSYLESKGIKANEEASRPIDVDAMLETLDTVFEIDRATE